MATNEEKTISLDAARQFYYRHDFPKWICFVAALLVVLCLIAPVAWLVKMSLTPEHKLFNMPPNFTEFSLGGYVKLFTQRQVFFQYYLNSLIVGSLTVLVCLSSGTLAAYSFSRFRYRGRSLAMQLLLSSQMFPWALLLIPLFISFSKVGLVNSYWGLVLAHSTFAFPLTTWILKSYFDTIPRELEESAEMDGCSKLRTLWSIILPVSLPGITAAGIYIFIFSWNDFIFGLTLANTDETRLLAPGIAAQFIGENRYAWVEMMAACVTVTLPLVILFLFFQRYFIQGLTAGALKE